MSNEMPLSVNTLTNIRDTNSTNLIKIDSKEKYAKSCTTGKVLVNGLRLVIICVCLFWFVFNAYIITGKYLEFDTIVSLRMEPPNEADMPGLTICGPYIILPNNLSKMFNDFKYEKTAGRTKKPTAEALQCRKKNYSYFENMAFETYPAMDIMENHSIRSSQLLADCKFNSVNLRHELDTNTNVTTKSFDCTDIAPIVESIYEGRKCFTYFSKFNKTYNNTVKMVYDMNPTIEITIRIWDNLWSYGSHDEEVIMTVHPPTIIPTHLDFEYFRIIKQFYYDVYFTKKTSTLKKKPYKTGCKDYDDEPEWNTRDECLNHCIKSESFAANNCANYYGVLTKSLFEPKDRICSKDVQNYTLYIEARRKCMSQCPPECTQIIYEIYGNVMDYEDQYSCNDDDDLNCIASVSIKVHHSPFTFINHTEALTTEEYIGTIGGHMGIWLGLSAIALFDLIISLIEKVKIRFSKSETDTNIDYSNSKQ